MATTVIFFLNIKQRIELYARWVAHWNPDHLRIYDPHFSAVPFSGLDSQTQMHY